MSVLKVISEECGHEVQRETLVDDLGLDSLELLDLMVKLGIPDSDVRHMRTVGDLIDYVSR